MSLNYVTFRTIFDIDFDCPKKSTSLDLSLLFRFNLINCTSAKNLQEIRTTNFEKFGFSVPKVLKTVFLKKTY